MTLLSKTLVAAVLLTATSSIPAAAQNMLVASPEAVADILRQYGSVEVTVAESGRPRLDADVDGLFYGVILYGCEDDRNACDSVDFYAFFDNNPLGIEAFNSWNDEYRFGTAINAGDGSAILVMAHSIYGGVTVENFVDAFEQYRESLNRFNEWAYSGGPNPPFPADAGSGGTSPAEPPKN